MSPTAEPTASGSDVGTLSAAPTLHPPEVPPDHPDQYSYGFVRYVYTGIAIVIVFGTLWYCCRYFLISIAKSNTAMLIGFLV
jgi:hypothetical protein